MAKRLKQKDHEKMTRNKVMVRKATIITMQEEKPQKDHEK